MGKSIWGRDLFSKHLWDRYYKKQFEEFLNRPPLWERFEKEEKEMARSKCKDVDGCCCDDVRCICGEPYPCSRSIPERLGMKEMKPKPKPKDLWRHRSKGMKCSSCMWYVQKTGEKVEGDNTYIYGFIGRCRRHAPTMEGYPVVFNEDWCGDHKLDENHRYG